MMLQVSKLTTQLTDEQWNERSSDKNAVCQVCTSELRIFIRWILSLKSEQTAALGNIGAAQNLNSHKVPDAVSQLPAFLRPLPSKIAAEDFQYLALKGALALPSIALQNALLQCYVEYVYPYMPLIDLHPFLSIVDRRDGVNGQTSLLLYQSIMFSAMAFVDIKHLRAAGFSSRKVARKAFVQKTKVSV